MAALAVVALGLAAACGGDEARGDELRLGYFLNLTHAAPVVGLERGIYGRRLPGVEIDTREFLAGPEAVTAMLSGSLDASYLGTGPVIVAASRVPGRLRVVAGANDAGAILVARAGSGITSVRDLDGRSVAFPGYGNTQDLALRLVLREAGLRAADQGGSVRLVKIRSADVATSLQRGQLDAALLPEPWGTLLVAAGDAEPLLDADEILGGRYPTTVLAVTERLATERPDVVRRLVAANCEAVSLVRRRPALVVDVFARELRGIQGRAPTRATLRRSVARLRPTTRVDARGLRALLEAAGRAGYLDGAVEPESLVAPIATQPCPPEEQGDPARP